MCGILGAIVPNINSYKFQEALDNISHRGPDGFGIWHDEHIMLGHRRLSIIDLSENGKQPMEFGERYVITFNGEIYNYIELKTELEQKGIKFRTQSDTEVLLALYAEYGPSCLNKLNGMWAFAIYDKVDQRVFFSRDRMGKKPLFYYQDNEQFVFGSEMKALYPLMKQVEPNSPVVQKATVDFFDYEATEDCVIKNIKRFPAASYGIYINGKITIQPYWNVLDTLVSVPDRYEEQVEMFKELFIDACKIRMRSDVTVGTALSGGIDSSATISTMAYIGKNIKDDAYNKDWQHAFVASFPGTILDETQEAKKVADYLGINATYLDIDPLKDIDNLFYYTYLFEDLYITSPIPFIQLYGQIKKNGTTVSLDGHGSDELFGGYPFEMTPKLLDDFPNAWKMKQTIQTIKDGGMESDRASLSDVWPYWRNGLKRVLTKKMGTGNQLDHYNNQLYKTTFKTILPTLLRNYDRYSMINGVEIRMPFLDHRIVSFAFSIPASSKVRNGYSKCIVRDAMKGFFPDDVRLLKKKTGFQTPFTDWIKGPLKQWINDEMTSSSFKNAQFIQPDQVASRIKKVINDGNASFADGQDAWVALMPYVWEKSLGYINNDTK